MNRSWLLPDTRSWHLPLPGSTRQCREGRVPLESNSVLWPAPSRPVIIHHVPKCFKYFSVRTGRTPLWQANASAAVSRIPFEQRREAACLLLLWLLISHDKHWGDTLKPMKKEAWGSGGESSCLEFLSHVLHSRPPEAVASLSQAATPPTKHHASRKTFFEMHVYLCMYVHISIHTRVDTYACRHTWIYVCLVYCQQPV